MSTLLKAVALVAAGMFVYWCWPALDWVERIGVCWFFCVIAAIWMLQDGTKHGMPDPYEQRELSNLYVPESWQWPERRA